MGCLYHILERKLANVRCNVARNKVIVQIIDVLEDVAGIWPELHNLVVPVVFGKHFERLDNVRSLGRNIDPFVYDLLKVARAIGKPLFYLSWIDHLENELPLMAVSCQADVLLER